MDQLVYITVIRLSVNVKCCNSYQLFFFGLLLCLTFTAGHAQSARDIISQYLNAVSNGHPEKWTRLKSAYIESEGSFNTGLAFNSTPDLLNTKVSKHKIYRIWPDLNRIDIWEDTVLAMSSYGVRKENFIVMGRSQPIPVFPGPYEEKFEFMPVTILNAVKKAKSVSLRGVVELDGNHCYEVEIVTRPLTWRLFIDESSFLLHSWSNSPNGDFSVLTSMFNYKDIDGLKFGMSERKSKNGVVFYWSDITLLELNTQIDPKIFEYHPR